MKVLLTGATGYIGGAVAEALRDAGHGVIGVVRTEEKARQLESKGYTARRGDLRDPAGLASAARDADSVIHVALQWGTETGALDEAAVRAMLEALADTDKPFVYTSGVWVMGDTGGRVFGEVSGLNPPPVVAWRPAVERLVLDTAGKKIRGVVIRPAMVFGRGGGVLAGFIQSAKQRGAVRIVGDGQNHWTWVHADDLANLYVLALEQSGPGELFLGAEGPALRVRDVAEAASRAAGAGGKVEEVPFQHAREEFGPLADGLALDQKVASTKAGRLLGWIPKGPTVLEELSSGSYAPAPIPG